MPNIQFEGTFTAIVTPFKDDADKSIDWDSYDRLVHAQLDAKIDGIVPCGTTGESPTLDHEEHIEVIRRTVKIAKGKSIVLAGAGSNSTREAIALSRAAERAGADAVMVVVPYYNRPSQEGLLEHFVAVAASVRCPVMIYNIPGRTGMDLAAATLAKIAERAPNVVATKEATGNVLRTQEIVRKMGSRMSVLSGDDGLTLPMISVGARGVISVTANVYPAAVRHATRLALDGKFDDARRAHFALMPVHEVMFIEASPGPVKAALAHKGFIQETVRGPLTTITAPSRAKVKETLVAYDGDRA
ncbi:MAG: 4-hydroxy-tetrahydrodipicolinate synthase [Polyangiaceae bacterium]|nr:4-hydroxy-tetrahydrodipicolinate synthase [Polyangiaceae bacterium]